LNPYREFLLVFDSIVAYKTSLKNYLKRPCMGRRHGRFSEGFAVRDIDNSAKINFYEKFKSRADKKADVGIGADSK
jgi:hypothetical protein